MKFKSSYLIIAIALFLVLVFLDQNRNAVPIKIILGSPFHLGLSVIIIISMIVAALMTLGVLYLISRYRKRKRK